MDKLLLKIEAKIFRILYNRFRGIVKIHYNFFGRNNCCKECILKDNNSKKCILFNKKFNRNPIEKCSRIFSPYYELFK